MFDNTKVYDVLYFQLEQYLAKIRTTMDERKAANLFNRSYGILDIILLLTEDKVLSQGKSKTLIKLQEEIHQMFLERFTDAMEETDEDTQSRKKTNALMDKFKDSLYRETER